MEDSTAKAGSFFSSPEGIISLETMKDRLKERQLLPKL